MITGTDVDAAATNGRSSGPPPGPRTGRRRRGPIILIVLAVILVPALVAVGWLWFQVNPPGEAGGPIEVQIERGWGVSRIGDELEQQGVIDSSLAFQLYVRFAGAGPFQAGTFKMQENMGASPAAAVLERAPALEYRKLALIPGLTLDMIADRVGQIPGLNRDVFLEVARSNTVRSRYQPAYVTSLEGLTWPDTYYVSKADDETTVLRTLVNQFDEQASRAGLEESADPYRTVIIASLIQTEAKLDKDRPQIAAVVENRLRDDMPLQIDATLLYARGSRVGPITDEDYERDSPYNTYRFRGLPPTPISTVTRTSIEAALHPADVPYKFYVLIDEDGSHKFATTFAEHERNVAEARRLGLLG